MTRALLSIVLLSCALLLGCSAEPPQPTAPSPAQAGPAGGEPSAQATPIFTDDFEKGKAESWAAGEGKAAATPGSEAVPPASH